MNKFIDKDVDRHIQEKKRRHDFILTSEYSSLCSFIHRFDSYADDSMGNDGYKINNLQKVIELRMHKIKLDHCE